MAWTDHAQARWQALAPRERSALGWAAAVVGAAALWAVLLAPALRTVRQSSASATQLRLELDRMQRLQRRAQALQAQASVPAAALLAQLKASLKPFGASAVLQVQADLVSVQLQQADAADLANWLAANGSQHGRPLEVHLRRDGTAQPPRWSGSLVFRLPQTAPDRP